MVKTVFKSEGVNGKRSDAQEMVAIGLIELMEGLFALSTIIDRLELRPEL